MQTISGTTPRKPNLGVVKFEADPLNSTYRWEFHLTPGMYGNKVAIMDGYSKGMGFENTNKLALLGNKLINPILKYHYKCDAIVIFEQTPGLPKAMHTKLIELYPHEFYVYDWVREVSGIQDYLGKWYSDYRVHGVMPQDDRRRNVRKDVYYAELDHSKYNFKSLTELQAFCDKMSARHSVQCMQIWYQKHAECQPELFEPDVADKLIHTVHTAPTADAAQAAMESYNALHNRMHSKFTGKS